MLKKRMLSIIFVLTILMGVALLPSCADETSDPLALEIISANNFDAPWILANQDDTVSIRVLSYNVKCADGGEKLDELAAEIKSTSAHIVFLQELDYSVERSGKVKQVEEIAKKAEYNYAYYPAVQLDGGLYGIAILSRFDIKSTQLFELESGDEEARILAKATIRINDIYIDVYNTHLSYEDEELRAAQLSFVVQKAAKSGTFILGGDFNVSSFDEYSAFGSLEKANTVKKDLVTFEDGEFGGIDNIVVSSDIKMSNSWVEKTLVSDHDLLLADIDIFLDGADDGSSQDESQTDAQDESQSDTQGDS